MKIKISDTRGNDVTCTLNESEAAHALERMLPLKTSLSDYASNEKGFMPPKKSMFLELHCLMEEQKY